jgi:hypothetical protein
MKAHLDSTGVSGTGSGRVGDVRVGRTSSDGAHLNGVGGELVIPVGLVYVLEVVSGWRGRRGSIPVNITSA